MSENANNLNPELARVADALGSLAPASTIISRDRLLFEAGRAAARQTSRIWPSSALFFAALAGALACFPLVREPAQTIVVERERFVEVRVPQPPSAVNVAVRREASLPEGDTAPVNQNLSPEALRSLQIRRDVLRWGPDMLPASTPAENTETTAAVANGIDLWLDLPPGTLAAPMSKAPHRFQNLFGDH